MRFLRMPFLSRAKGRPIDQLDDVPAGAPEFGFQFLDDLLLPRTGPSRRCRLQLMTKTRLSSFAAGHADGAQGFDLVGLAVAEEGPDLALGPLAASIRLREARYFMKRAW